MRLLRTFSRLKSAVVVKLQVKDCGLRPAISHVVHTGLSMGAGDIITQHFVEKKTWNNHDIWRTVRLTGIGLIIIGPMFHAWYDIFLNKRYHQRTMAIALKKVVWDQGLFAPVFLVLFYSSVGLFELSPFKNTVDRIRLEFLPSMVVNYVIWPAVQLMNFYYIHTPKYNILVVNTVSIFWNSFLSWAAHKRIQATSKLGKDAYTVTG